MKFFEYSTFEFYSKLKFFEYSTFEFYSKSQIFEYSTFRIIRIRMIYSNDRIIIRFGPKYNALANVKHPHDQGVVAIMGVFIDTFIVVSLNAIVIISTMYTNGAALANGYRGAVTETIKNTNLAQVAFGSVFGTHMGAIVVAIMLFFFAFSSILSWNFFGRVNIIYLLGAKAKAAYLCIALSFIFLGTVMSSDLVWKLSDLFNQLMVLPNVIALLALTSLVSKIAKEGSSRGRRS